MQFVKSAVKPVNIRRLLHEHIRYTEFERDAGNFHASDVTREDPAWCARSAVLKKKTGYVGKPQYVQTSMAVTWEWGRMTETRVRDWFAAMGMLVGDWQCSHKPCRQLHAWTKKPKVCACGGEAFDYRERRAISQESGVSCGLDLLLDVGRPQLILGEVKSIDKEKFKELAGPKAEHRLRTRIYLKAIAESGDERLARINPHEGFVLYVSKGGFGVQTEEMHDWPFPDGKFSPFKSYWVKRADDEVEYLTDQVRAARDALLGNGPIPPRTCPTHLCQRAQQCGVMKTCFSSDNW